MASILAADECLGAIFDDEQVVLFCQIDDRRHIDMGAKQVGHENGTSARRDGALQLFGERLQRVRVDIDRHRHELVMLDDANHVRDGDRREDHFAARWQPQCCEQQI